MEGERGGGGDSPASILTCSHWSCRLPSHLSLACSPSHRFMLAVDCHWQPSCQYWAATPVYCCNVRGRTASAIERGGKVRG
jgi:hypothetical protein